MDWGWTGQSSDHLSEEVSEWGPSLRQCGGCSGSSSVAAAVAAAVAIWQQQQQRYWRQWSLRSASVEQQHLAAYSAAGAVVNHVGLSCTVSTVSVEVVCAHMLCWSRCWW